jgi:uncharacterized membrane protein
LNSQEYIRKLERLLKKLHEEERRDAIRYYEEYFAEAGEEKAQEVIWRLGSPAQVAAGIRADFAMRAIESESRPQMKKGISAVWLAILGVFALPVALPLAVSGFVVVLALFITILTVVFSLFVVAISMIAAGLFALICGLILLAQNPAVGLFYLGGGLAVASAGLLFFLFCIWLGRTGFRGVACLINRIRLRRRKRTGEGPERPAYPENAEKEVTSHV